MAIDKKIDYVDQDGYKNYTKNSKSVTVPKEFKARKNAPATKLAYITDAEEKQLKKQNPGTPHKGPSNVPSYDSFDAQGSYTSGSAMSAAETGSSNARDRAEVRASNIGAPKGAGPGVRSNQERDLRSSFIAAGAGQRVNPGFFDSRNVVSPAELARARAFNPAAFKATRGGGLMNFFTGGGLLGNIIRGIGQRFGLGKRFNEPTYDMSRFNKLGLGGIDPFANLDIRDIYDRRKTDEEDEDIDLKTGTFNPLAFDNQDQTRFFSSNIPFGGTVLEDEFPSTRVPDMRDLGNPLMDPRIVPEEFGLEPGPRAFTVKDRRREESPKLGIGSDYGKDVDNYLEGPYDDPYLDPYPNIYQNLSQADNRGIMQLAELATNSPALAQQRSLQKKKRLSELGGPEFTEEDQQKLDLLNQMEADPNKIYSQTV